jgi:hypothetical protein
MRKVYFVTHVQLECAVRSIVRELIYHGVWEKRLAAIPVSLVPCSRYYGWQAYGTTGEIGIPAVSVCRIRDWWRGDYVSLRDVLRHEYAHAIAHVWPGLIRSRRFKAAFGASHKSEISTPFDPDLHISEYAATSPSEDFAETFMYFLRDKGCLRPWNNTPVLRRKWRFIQQLCSAIQAGVSKL